MQIIYQGVDITDMVQVTRCVSRDTADNRCDSLDIEFENATGWYGWQPQEDDQIVVDQDGYDTGIMYLNTILPEDGRYRIYATALPCAAREKGWQSFIGNTIEEIMRICAVNCGMDYRIFGIDGKTVIPYIQRENEGCAAFLSRLLKLEGAVLKCINGNFTAIGIQFAQELVPHQTIEIMADQTGCEYTRCGKTLRSLTVSTPYGKATAEDTDVPTEHSSRTVSDVPAKDSAQAGRWAVGLLLHENRKCESLCVESEFNVGFTAMTRIDIEGGTDATGEWLIEEAEHDYINMKSTARMRRCIWSIQ